MQEFLKNHADSSPFLVDSKGMTFVKLEGGF